MKRMINWTSSLNLESVLGSPSDIMNVLVSDYFIEMDDANVLDYDALKQLYDLKDNTIIDLILKDKLKSFLRVHDYYPNFMSSENRAKAYFMGYSPKMVNQLNYLDNLNLLKYEIKFDDKWKDRKLMDILELNYYDKHKGSNPNNYDMRIKLIPTEEEIKKFRNRFYRAFNQSAKINNQ